VASFAVRVCGEQQGEKSAISGAQISGRPPQQAALSVLAFNIIRASNAFGTGALMSRG